MSWYWHTTEQIPVSDDAFAPEFTDLGGALNLQLGTIIGWGPNRNERPLLYGKLVSASAWAKDGVSLYPDLPAGFAWIWWYQVGATSLNVPSTSQQQAVWNRIGAYFQQRFPSTAEGYCTGSLSGWPLPQRQWGRGSFGTVPCVAQNIVQNGIPVTSTYTRMWETAIAATQAAGNHETAAGMASGNVPFVMVTVYGREGLNEVAVVDGRDGTWRRNNLGIYWDGNASRMLVQFFEYFDKRIDGVIGWLENPFAVVGYIVGEVMEIIQQYGCNEAGYAVATYYGSGDTMRKMCAAPPPPPGPSSKSTLVWGALGLGTVAVGMLAVLALKKRRG